MEPLHYKQACCEPNLLQHIAPPYNGVGNIYCQSHRVHKQLLPQGNMPRYKGFLREIIPNLFALCIFHPCKGSWFRNVEDSATLEHSWKVTPLNQEKIHFITKHKRNHSQTLKLNQ